MINSPKFEPNQMVVVNDPAQGFYDAVGIVDDADEWVLETGEYWVNFLYLNDAAYIEAHNLTPFAVPQDDYEPLDSDEVSAYEFAVANGCLWVLR
jgi:hypothetical protein